ncbi:MAG TPA: ferredoxin [Methanothermobacter sp.]|nr:ferredoxin [Methanothermobacter sp. MT-2]HHW04905.1 ferredoxin [Methanothermobacter sp.]HOK73264.1 ferredoxin [Methanothermobacter sp.]HOL69557.1 ferredoxin [Methanothermobacter sp.]HPQ05128.1 ferredoxin [Methanothermobacter sp.]
MYRLELDRTMCISCGTCIDLCPDLFEFAENGLSSIKEVELSELQRLEMEDPLCSIDAMENCPVKTIHVYEDDEEIK